MLSILRCQTKSCNRHSWLPTIVSKTTSYRLFIWKQQKTYQISSSIISSSKPSSSLTPSSSIGTSIWSSWPPSFCSSSIGSWSSWCFERYFCPFLNIKNLPIVDVQVHGNVHIDIVEDADVGDNRCRRMIAQNRDNVLIINLDKLIQNTWKLACACSCSSLNTSWYFWFNRMS